MAFLNWHQYFELFKLDKIEGILKIYDFLSGMDRDNFEKFEFVNDLIEFCQKLETESIVRTTIHDISTPITSINVNSDFILSILKESHNELIIESMNSIKSQINQLKNNFEDIRYQKIEINSNKVAINQSFLYIEEQKRILNPDVEILIQDQLLDKIKFYDFLHLFTLQNLLKISTLRFLVLSVDSNDIPLIHAFFEKNLTSFQTMSILNFNSLTTEGWVISLFNRILPKYDYIVTIDVKEEEYTLITIKAPMF